MSSSSFAACCKKFISSCCCGDISDDSDEEGLLSSSNNGSTSDYHHIETKPEIRPVSCTANSQPVITHQPSRNSQVLRPPKVIKPLRKEQYYEEKESELETLKKYKEEMQQRVATYNQICIKTAIRTKRNEAEKKALKQYYEKLLLKIKGHLEDLTQHRMEKHLFLELSQKETYKPYGLLLSALELKRSGRASTYLPETEHKFTKDILSFIAEKHSTPDTSNEALENHISKALDLTFTMLTLLPPLIVCLTTEYCEEFHDTCRRRWIESSINQSLHYYRPILVYGNKGEVAVKGLVGNIDNEIED